MVNGTGVSIQMDLLIEKTTKQASGNAHITTEECAWKSSKDCLKLHLRASGENAVALENELRWKASMLPFAKGKEVVPVIFAKNATNQTDTAIVITPEGIMDLMK